MIKLLRILTAAVVYFCAATLMAQGIGVGVLWFRGTLTSDNWYELLAIVHGVDTEAIRREMGDEKRRRRNASGIVRGRVAGPARKKPHAVAAAAGD